MRYRKLDAHGDYPFGNRQQDFYCDNPQAVAQAVQTRLALFTGEWFLDTADGTPWHTDVLSRAPTETGDMTIRERILDTLGVMRIVHYARQFDAETRTHSITATIETAYGPTTATTTL